ncbi:fungal pheromone mating factor STE2 GPCR-domain-containing protein [Podospora conica]|nr:fungal pheromone mating factor STE2 GPCR-domain-containing protein [Schizothecium conicum]
MAFNDPANKGVQSTSWAVTLTSPAGVNTTAPLEYVNKIWVYANSASINYASQIGACFIMLVVVLAMTPRKRFKRATTIIHTLALTLNMIRMVLLAYYFTSSWFTMSVFLAGDMASVDSHDMDTSVATTILSIPVVILIEMALFLQAWSMVQLWSRVWKVGTTMLSLALVLTTVAFNIVNTVTQVQHGMRSESTIDTLWIPKTYLILLTTSITWFCFLFISRLVMHMYSTRSILPSMQGLTAMDILVITNGVLMLIPVIFAALEFGVFYNFESASLTQTSVIVVLPLGTLVAQRLANPSWLSTTSGSGSTTAAGTYNSANASSGGGTRPHSNAAKRRLLSVTTNNTTHSARGDACDSFSFRGGVPHGAGNGSVSSEVRGGYSSEKSSAGTGRFRGDNIDAELARIDSEGGGAEGGQDIDLERGVRVDRVIDMSVERKGSASGGGEKEGRSS